MVTCRILPERVEKRKDSEAGHAKDMRGFSFRGVAGGPAASARKRQENLLFGWLASALVLNTEIYGDGDLLKGFVTLVEKFSPRKDVNQQTAEPLRKVETKPQLPKQSGFHVKKIAPRKSPVGQGFVA
eukprot:s135_g7.t1